MTGQIFDRLTPKPLLLTLPPGRSPWRDREEEIRDDSHAKGELPLIWELPGQGERGVSCGEEILVRCQDCGYLAWMESSCRERACPSCMRKWAFKEARRARDRLVAGARFYTLHWRARHVIVSPPQDGLPGTREEIAALRQGARDVLKRVGFYGGAMVFHPWRCKQGWAEGPHFHVIGYGALNVAEAVREDREAGVEPLGGWVVKGKPKRKTVSGTIFYVLTHAGLSRGTHSLTWFGWWSYSCLKGAEFTFPIRQDTTAVGRCPKCDGDLERVPQDDVLAFGWDLCP